MPKNIVMLWVGDGKLAKSQGELPPGSLVYPDPRTQKGMCLDFESKTFSTLRDLARKYNVSDILAFRSFPPGAPGDLVPDGTTWVMESVNPLISRLKLASDAIDHMGWVWCFVVKNSKLVAFGLKIAYIPRSFSRLLSMSSIS